jgi:hypothetical protein
MAVTLRKNDGRAAVLYVTGGQVVKQHSHLVGSATPRGAIALELLALGLELGAAVILLKDLFTRAPAATSGV